MFISKINRYLFCTYLVISLWINVFLIPGKVQSVEMQRHVHCPNWLNNNSYQPKKKNVKHCNEYKGFASLLGVFFSNITIWCIVLLYMHYSDLFFFFLSFSLCLLCVIIIRYIGSLIDCAKEHNENLEIVFARNCFAFTFVFFFFFYNTQCSLLNKLNEIVTVLLNRF
jgi:hypothetical protein